MTTELQQGNNVSESTPKNFDKKAYQKAWYEANKARKKETSKAWREANKERQKAWYEANKEQRRERQKAYREANKEQRKDYNKAYYKANKEKIVESNAIYKKQKLKEDPLFAAKYKLRQLVTHSFRRIGKNKPTDTLSLLGCSWQQAKEHFERLFKEGMSWENHGLWHIDHIRPVASFAENELHLMNHISNLQPLWAEENYSKSIIHSIL